jgi:hypothetical protein
VPLPQVAGRLEFDHLHRESDFGFQDVAVRGRTALAGYFQSEKYFADIADRVRAQFSLHDHLLGEIRRAYGDPRGAGTCSIHVRRTDYLTHPAMFDLSSTDYYDQAISQFESATTFYVFSDDISWCKQRFRNRHFIFVEGLADVGDLQLMSRCDAHVIANSSFSWWGAWLDPNASKRVIAPSQWFRGTSADPSVPFVAGPPHSGYHSTKDLVPRQWTSVAATTPVADEALLEH